MSKGCFGRPVGTRCTDEHPLAHSPVYCSGWVSLCHPWSSGPAPWLSSWILGVRPAAPGFARALIAPHLTPAMTVAGLRGSVPTPHGPIRVAVLPLSSGISACASIELGVPSSGVESVTLRLSAVLLARLGVISSASLWSFTSSKLALASAGLVFERTAGDGTHALPVQLPFTVEQRDDAPLVNESCAACGRSAVAEVELSFVSPATTTLHICSPSPPSPRKPPTFQSGPFPPPAWPGRFISADYETQGAWVGHYGASGFVLFGFDQPSAGGSDPFCGVTGEGGSVQLQVRRLPLEPRATSGRLSPLVSTLLLRSVKMRARR